MAFKYRVGKITAILSCGMAVCAIQAHAGPLRPSVEPPRGIDAPETPRKAPKKEPTNPDSAPTQDADRNKAAVSAKIPDPITFNLVEMINGSAGDFEQRVRDKKLENFNGCSFRRTFQSVAARDRSAVGSIAIYMQLDFRDEEWGRSGGVNVLVVTEVCPRLSNGNISFDVKSYFADVRPFDDAPGDIGEDKAMDKINKRGQSNLETLESEVRSEIMKRINEVPGFSLIQGHIASLRMEGPNVIVSLGIPGSGWCATDSSSQRFDHWGLSNAWGHEEDAALVVVAFAKTTQRKVFSQGVNPSIYKRDRTGGIRLFLPHNFRRDHLGSDEGAFRDQDWGNEISTIVIFPGPAYKGEKLKLFANAGEKAHQGRSGDVLELGPGWYALNLKECLNMKDSTSQIEVVGP